MSEDVAKVQNQPQSIRDAMMAEDRRAGHSPRLEISGYSVQRKIGAGGMSSVYLAERQSDGMLTVLKLFNADLSRENEFLRRFIREYGILSKISSPNIVKIFDQGYSDQHVYIAMEYFAGGDLKARIDRGMAPDEAVALTLRKWPRVCKQFMRPKSFIAI